MTSPIDTLNGPGYERSEWNVESQSHADLISLPLPSGKIPVSVYSFRDQTGQYKPSPSSTFSTAVTQGASSLLVKALWESGWFQPLEREGLQNLLTERKIIRAANGENTSTLPQLRSASILLEGGIVGYDSNIQTGGAGAKYIGVGSSEKYRVDQVTVNLRAIDINSGLVLNSVTTTKKVFSQETTAGVFKFVKFKELLEVEAGYTTNEPAQIAVLDAIETAVIRLIVTGIGEKHWQVADASDMNHPTLLSYQNKSRKPTYSRSATPNSKPVRYKKTNRHNPVISEIVNTVSEKIVDNSGKLMPGTYTSTDFMVQIVDLGDGRTSVTTRDRFTGLSESFTVSSIL
ncbi:hypothetical protein A9Q99_16715 [Gammaproteobacteria bacterium 45_16_T64]|nr:hypothetical protein A9Q99_16715 [Gammaproteobacteria bacterium 45_16_T64]